MIPVAVIFGLVLGGIYGGFFNPDPGRRRGRGAGLDLRCVQAHDRHSRTDGR
jgi:hypothetical protein